MQYVSGFPFMSLEGRRVVVVRILCSGVLYIEEQSLWGYIQAPNPSLGFSPSWAWETGSPERSAPAANRRHRRPLQPNPLLGFPTAQGRGAGSRSNTLGALATLPLTRCPGSLRTASVSPAAASMRGASRGWRIPGVRGARPAPPAGPAPGSCAPACGSPAQPRRSRLPGCAWAAGGAAVARRGLGGVAGLSECGSSSGRRSAAAGLSRGSPPACRPAAARRNGGEQFAGGGAEEDSEPAGAGGRRGGARGQPAARAGLREEAEGDRKGPTHHPSPEAPSPQSAPPRPAGPPGAHLPPPPLPPPRGAPGPAGVGLWGGALPVHFSPFHLAGLKNRGRISGVEKVLEAAPSQKELYVWGVCVRPGVSGPPACALCAAGIIYSESGDGRGPFFWKSVLLGRALTGHV